MEYYSAIKKNEIMSFSENGWYWKLIISQVQKDKYDMLSVICESVLKTNKHMNIQGSAI
jgi:hypothetical protein